MTRPRVLPKVVKSSSPSASSANDRGEVAEAAAAPVVGASAVARVGQVVADHAEAKFARPGASRPRRTVSAVEDGRCRRCRPRPSSARRAPPRRPVRRAASVRSRRSRSSRRGGAPAPARMSVQTRCMPAGSNSLHVAATPSRDVAAVDDRVDDGEPEGLAAATPGSTPQAPRDGRRERGPCSPGSGRARSSILPGRSALPPCPRRARWEPHPGRRPAPATSSSCRRGPLRAAPDPPLRPGAQARRKQTSAGLDGVTRADPNSAGRQGRRVFRRSPRATRCVHRAAARKKLDRRLLTRRFSQKATRQDAAATPCETDSKAMTPTSPRGRPSQPSRLSRERHFAGGVQQKKVVIARYLNVNETKSMDGRREPVIAPSTFASGPMRGTFTTPMFPCGSRRESFGLETSHETGKSRGTRIVTARSRPSMTSPMRLQGDPGLHWQSSSTRRLEPGLDACG